MAEQSTIARPYAKAIYAMACQSDHVLVWSQVLEVLSITVSDPFVLAKIDNPVVSDSQLQAFLLGIIHDCLDLTEDQIKTRVEKTIALLIQWHRLSIIKDIYHLYQRLVVESEGLKQVSVTSAYELHDEQKQALLSGLKQRFQSDVSIDYSLDPMLMGGFVVRNEDWVMDCSISGKLARLNESLL